MERIGFWTDVSTFYSGLSDSRVQWLAKFLRDLSSEKAVLGQTLHQFLGRLAYATGALEYGKPFIGPLYA